jgi:hypothetical protein
MLFGSAAAVAILLLVESAQPPKRTPNLLWTDLAARPTQVDLRPKLPFDIKSIKVMGASGIGIWAPIAESLAFGVAATSFRLDPTHRAVQVVAGIRFRF